MEYNIGDRIVDDKRDLTIIGKRKAVRSYYYQYRCNKCGYECQDGYRAGEPFKGLWRTAYEFDSGHKGCACCNHSITVPGINSIADTHPELTKYFINGDEYKYPATSSSIVSMICPQCGHIRKQTISVLTINGLSCPLCANTISIGERIMCSLLKFQNIEFKKEFAFPDNKKRYDFYLSEYNTIIEIHGSQHYVQTSNTWGTVKEQQQNDEYKKQFALNQGISHYIVINAKVSEFNYIKDSIINSELASIISLDNVDWIEIEDEVNQNGVVKEMCEYWESHPEATIVDLENMFHRSEKIIYDRLKIGYEMGWCHKRDTKAPVIRPIKYVDTNIYFRDAKIASRNSIEFFGKKIPDSTIRYKAKHNKEFQYISREEFNSAYDNGCLCIGDKFTKVV